MDQTESIFLDDGVDAFKRLAAYAMKKDYFACYLTSYDQFRIAIGEKRSITILDCEGGFEKLKTFQNDAELRIAGYLGYDLKNDLEDLESGNPSALGLPEAVFFEPEYWVEVKDGFLTLEGAGPQDFEIIKTILSEPCLRIYSDSSYKINPETSKETYLEIAEKLREHLKHGDIYEANYCIQFSGEVENFDVLVQFTRLFERTKAPFSVLAGLKGNYILSASPERFLKNTSGKLISQPIKGTIKRSFDPELDELNKTILFNDPKEQSENVMIVDLVRNDLSRVAKRNSVLVKELFGVKTFETVHHLVSTVQAELDLDKFDHWDAIKAAFPMGSMTGAPKISAMKIIDNCESFKRSAYSGAFGWIEPNGDFDFNVLIRTLFYSSNLSKLTFSVGSAITIGAHPEKEYDECILKAQALFDTLEDTILKDGPASVV